MFVKIAGKAVGLNGNESVWKDMNIVIRWCFCVFAYKGWGWGREIRSGP